MAWDVTMNNETGFIEEVFSGTVTIQDISDAMAKILTFAQIDTPLKFKVNVVDANIDISVIELFKLPGTWDDLGFGRGNSMCVITGGSSEQTEALLFLETVSINRGWNVKVFTSEKEAIQWLSKQHPSKPL